MRTITKECLYCKQNFEASLREHNRGNGKFCNLKCASAFNSVARAEKNRKEPNCTCDLCGVFFRRNASRLNNSKSGLNFCTRSCKDQAQRLENGFTQIHPTHYGNNRATYRTLAFRHMPSECLDCKYSSHVDVLEVHHVDSNRKNCAIENLVIVCPTCHVERHAGHRSNTNYAGIVIEMVSTLGAAPSFPLSESDSDLAPRPQR